MSMDIGQMRIQDNLEVGIAIEDESDADDPDKVYEYDGQLYEDIRVWNHLNVTIAHQVHGEGRLETFLGSSRIEKGGGGAEPDYVTTWVAEELWHEHNIDLGLFDHGGTDEFDIEVIDIESDEVRVL